MNDNDELYYYNLHLHIQDVQYERLPIFAEVLALWRAHKSTTPTMPTYCKIIGGITWYGWCNRLVNSRKSYNLSKITHQIKIENNNTTGTHLLPQCHVNGSGTEAQCIQSTINCYIGSRTTDQAHIKYPSRKP